MFSYLLFPIFTALFSHNAKENPSPKQPSNTASDSIYIGKKKLVWSEEFNYNGAPDSTKWVYDIGKGDNGWGNNEQEYYTNRPENIIVENGVLKIRAIRENYNGGTFTSARIKTLGKFDFKYGRIEIRAKVPGGKGPGLRRGC